MHAAIHRCVLSGELKKDVPEVDKKACAWTLAPYQKVNSHSPKIYYIKVAKMILFFIPFHPISQRHPLMLDSAINSKTIQTHSNPHYLVMRLINKYTQSSNSLLIHFAEKDSQVCENTTHVLSP